MSRIEVSDLPFRPSIDWVYSSKEICIYCEGLYSFSEIQRQQSRTRIIFLFFIEVFPGFISEKS